MFFFFFLNNTSTYFKTSLAVVLLAFFRALKFCTQNRSFSLPKNPCLKKKVHSQTHSHAPTHTHTSLFLLRSNQTDPKHRALTLYSCLHLLLISLSVSLPADWAALVRCAFSRAPPALGQLERPYLLFRSVWCLFVSSISFSFLSFLPNKTCWGYSVYVYVCMCVGV
jgi:hypothetical protein